MLSTEAASTRSSEVEPIGSSMNILGQTIACSLVLLTRSRSITLEETSTLWGVTLYVNVFICSDAGESSIPTSSPSLFCCSPEDLDGSGDDCDRPPRLFLPTMVIGT